MKNSILILLLFIGYSAFAQEISTSEPIKSQKLSSKDSIYTQNKGYIAILNKKVAYVYYNKQVPRESIPTTFNPFYPVRYVLIAENYQAKGCVYDYVFYVYNSHQEQFINEKLIQKKLKKVNCNIQDCSLKEMQVSIANNEHTYHINATFNGCKYEWNRRNILKKDLLDKYPILKYKNIKVKEIRREQHNQYRYEVNVFDGRNIIGQVLYPQVKDASEIPDDILRSGDKMGVDDTSVLNEYEANYLNFVFKINPEDFNLTNKKIAFLTGSSGKAKGSKKEYFSGAIHPVAIGGLYIFNDAQKKASGGYDGAIAYWVKLLVPIKTVVERLGKNKIHQ
jgi:hypothetical protein